MAELSFPLENTEYGAEEAQLWFSSRTSGVFASQELGVTASDGMTVELGKGRAWLAHADFAGIVYANTLETGLTVPTSDAYFDRIDRVIVRFDKTGNTVNAMIISGTPSSSPQPPGITRDASVYDISLAQVLVKKGATEIDAADITDERLDETVCGLMRDGVTGIDTSVFSAQWSSFLQRIAHELENVTGGALILMKRLSTTCTAGAWTAQADGSYAQTVSVGGVLETDAGHADVDLSDASPASAKQILSAWSLVGRVYTVAGGISFVCYGPKPSVDIPVIVEVIG